MLARTTVRQLTKRYMVLSPYTFLAFSTYLRVEVGGGWRGGESWGWGHQNIVVTSQTQKAMAVEWDLGNLLPSVHKLASAFVVLPAGKREEDEEGR